MPPTHSPAHDAKLFDLLQILFDHQQTIWSSENPDTDKYRGLLHVLQVNNWERLTKEDMDMLDKEWKANQAVDFSKLPYNGNKVLYLPAAEKETKFLVVMAMRCDVKMKCTKIRIMMIKEKTEEEFELLPASEYWGIGFRLESPENSLNDHGDEDDNVQNDGMHDFYHAQWIKDFKGKGTVFYDTISWLPVKQPSIPILAYESLTMMFSLLVSLYGKKWFKHFWHIYGTRLAFISQSLCVKEFLATINS